MNIFLCILIAIFYFVSLFSLIRIGEHSNWLSSFRDALQPGIDHLIAFNWTITGDELMEFEPSDSELVSTTIQSVNQSEIEGGDNGEIGRETNGSLFSTTLVNASHLDSGMTENRSESTQPVVNRSLPSTSSTDSERYIEDSKVTYPEKVVYYDWGDQKYGNNSIVLNNHNE